MTNGLDERRRTQEEDYFRRQEQELLAGLRKRSEGEEGRRRLAEAAGIADESLLEELLGAGYTEQTVPALWLAPAVQVAWAEGRVQGAERRAIMEMAAEHGFGEGTAAGAEITRWLDTRPSGEFFERALRFLRAALAALPEGERRRRADELIADCNRVARAAGGAGFVSFGNRVSGEERRVIERLLEELDGDGTADRGA